MKRFVWVALCSVCLTAGPDAQETASRSTNSRDVPAGSWEGLLEAPGRPMVLTLRVQDDAGALKATLEISGQRSIALAGSVDKSHVLMLSGGDPRIVISARSEGAVMAGTLTQRGQPLPFRLEREPELPRPVSRAEAWKQDLEVAVRKLPRYDRSMSPQEARQYREVVAGLLTRIDGTSDAELVVGLARAVALAGNAHTRLYLLRNRTELRRLPIRLWWFGDSLRVVRATARHREIVGCEVMRIVEQSTTAVRNVVVPLFAGNTSWQTYMSVYSMTSPEVLFGLRLVRDMENIPWQFRCDGRVVNADLRPLPLRPRASPTEAWRDLSPAFRADDDGEWVSVPLRDPLPFYLRHPERFYWHSYTADQQTLYVNYSRSQQMPTGPSIREYAEAIGRELESKPVKRMVIDLRFNTGGDLGLGRAAMEGLRALAREKGATVVIISGRATFSAALFHLAQWKEWGARIVGEPAGDELDFWAEGGNIILPNSKLYVHYANGFHAYSTKEYPDLKPYFADLSVHTVAPDVLVPMAWEAYSRGDDPALRLAAGDR